MKIKPAAIRFIANSPRGEFGAYLRACVDILGKSTIGPIESWEVPALKLKGDGAPDAPIKRFSESGAQPDEATYLKLIAPEDTTVTLRSVVVESQKLFSMRVERQVSPDATKDSLIAFMRDATGICRAVVKQTNAVSAKLTPIGGGATCIPSPPLVEHNSHIVVTTEAEVARYYDTRKAFWDSGWESVETIGARRLLLRGMDTVCGPEYLERIIAQQWRLARAAKADETGYALPQPEQSELGIFRSGASQLEPVGYVASEQAVEYSCALARGQVIPGWQIYALWDLRQARKLEDGRPVKIVRVVFLEEWAARQEKRPLLDIGCRVYHYDADGELKELTE